MIIVFILFCCGCLLYAYRNWRRSTENEPPLSSRALPIIGHAHLLVGDSTYLWGLLKLLAQQCLEKGGVVTSLIGPKTVYVIADPDDFLTVSNTCLQKSIFYEFAKPWLGEGLVTGDVSIWKTHRKLLNPAFNQAVLDGFLGVFNSQARNLVKDLSVESGKGPFNHTRYFRYNALETICLTALGASDDEDSIIDTQYVDAIETMFNILVERFQKFWMHLPFIYNLTRLKTKQDTLLKILHNKSYTILQQRKKEINTQKRPENKTECISKRKYKAFLDLLLELADDKKTFTDLEIRQHVDTMIVGGHDTSANVLMYTMIMVGSHPNVQDKIYKELQEVLGNADKDIEKQDLPKLIYLEAVIKETLRFIPIVPIIARYLDRDVKLKNYTLKAGRTCFMSIYGLSRHEKWGPDAETFRPERWFDLDTLPETNIQFAGFSMGRRICIGKTYALMSMKTTLAHVLRSYQISADYTKMTLKMDVMLKPVCGHHISIHSRQSN